MKLSRRFFLSGGSLAVLALFATNAEAWPVHGSFFAIPSTVWMETPDILAFTVDDPPIIPGNFVSGSFSGHAYDVGFQMTNPRSGNLEWCAPIGPLRDQVRFSDLPNPAGYISHADLNTLGNYSITGGVNATAIYYRNESIGQGNVFTTSPNAPTSLMITQRHTVYLKLSAPMTQNATYTITNSAGAFTPIKFTFNDKRMRAGGIQVNQIGPRPDDTYKYAYLASRIPIGPNSGTVDFAGTYGLSTFQIIDSSGNSVFSGSLTLRLGGFQAGTNEGYNSGIDVADLSNYYPVTGMTANGTTSITVTSPSHPFVGGDKVRFVGISGMELSSVGIDQGPTPVSAAGPWVGATVSNVTTNTFDVNLNGSGRSAFSTTPLYSTTFGSVNNKVVRTFNTNRAGTYVFGMDLSSWTPTPGTYHIYIPGYGISDPIPIASNNWAQAAAATHEGLYNLRLGCALNLSPGYSRGIALADGVNGCTNYISTIVAPFSSECASSISVAPTTPSGNGAYAPGSGTGPGFVTNVRATGYASRTQDAGDNDDLAVDHLPAWANLGWTLFELPKNSRFTPFNVPPTTSLLDPTLYAGADSLPPLVQELFWYADGYRTSQNPDGSTFGGMGLGHFSSQIPNYPEPISNYRGTDAGGTLAGQTVMGFMYACDHWGTFAYAAVAAKIAQLANDYGLTTLANTWQASAIAAYSWADGILTNQTTRDTYYNTTLGLSTKMGWTALQYQNSMVVLNARAVVQKSIAACFLFRLLGSVSGASYGNFITQRYCGANPNLASGGTETGYAAGDTIDLGNGIIVLVTAVSSGHITGISLMNQGQFAVTPTNPVAQVSTTGSGTGATFNLVSAVSGYYTSSNVTATIGALDYIQTLGADATAKTYLQGHYPQGVPDPATFYLSSTTAYQGMYAIGGTSGGTTFNAPIQMIQYHRNYVLASGASPASENHLKALQAGGTFIQGANLPNRTFIVGAGTRSQTIVLHEDSFKLGVASPRGINPFGYFAWATSSMVNNFGNGVNSDGPLTYNAEYSTGSFQSNPTPGSAKLWDPLRWASSYWEWSPQNKSIIFSDEYQQGGMINTIISQLYCHGWDGNV